ncbi:MAG TPA: FtsX-like permease family protein, partial [Ohtaekwangia sp.]
SDKIKLQQSLDRIATEVNSQSKDARVAFSLQPLGEITPGPDLENSIGPDTDITLLVVFTTICLLILLPACFNYASISIARALKRSKEIGLRKTMGGAKSQIFFQFIAETVTITLLALAGAMLIFLLIRPGFEDMMPGAWLDLSLTWEMAGMFLLFAVVSGLLTGIFPALYFAGLNPIQALRGKSNVNGSFSHTRVRKGLVVFQFALSFCFIVLLIVFSRQYRYNLNYNYGFNTENILDVELQGTDPAAFRTEFSRLAAVQNISMSSGILGLSYSRTQVREEAGSDSLGVSQLFVDHNYVGNMGLELLAGRNFPDTPSPQEQHILVNEEFLRAWKITRPRDAIGKTFMVDGKPLEVIGVLKNFHFASLQEPIKSFFLRTDPLRYTYANLNVASADMQVTRTDMERIWNTLNHSRKFEAHFFDDEMEWVYHFYRALLRLIGYLGLLAISISVLGLLGMVIYSMETRIKEVGIRKVFGATEANLTYLLSKDFVKLMLWAVTLAIPFCFQVFDGILSGMQHYRVNLNLWDILAGLVVFFFVGVITVASQTRKAARANPVETLRCE